MITKKITVAKKFAEKRIEEYEEATLGLTKKITKSNQDNDEINKISEA